MTNKLTITLFLFYSQFLCMHIKDLGSSANKDPHINEISTALQSDPFFKEVSLKQFFGRGTYGSVYSASKDNKLYAVKITTEYLLDHIPAFITENELKLPDDNISIIYNNLRFLKYLDQQNVPFILKTYTDRNILILDEYNEPEYKNVWLQEFADLTDMKKLAENLKSKDDNFKYKVVKILLYRLAYAFDNIVDLDIIHGDVKPQNIFMKTCNIGEGKKGGYGDSGKDIPEPINLCPIIGDWDLGYYIKSDYTNQIRYTPLYRPIEMFNLSLGDELLHRETKYSYTKKEDVYALGVSIIDLILTSKLSLEKIPNHANLKKLLDNMVYPLSYNDIETIINKKISPPQKIEDIMSKLDKNYAYYLRKIKEYYEKIYKQLSGDSRNDCKTIFNKYKQLFTKFMPFSYYHTLKDCLIAVHDCDDKLKKAVFNKDYHDYLKTIEMMKTYNHAEMISKNRSTMKDTLKQIETILKDDKEMKDILMQPKMNNFLNMNDKKIIVTEPKVKKVSIDDAIIGNEKKEQNTSFSDNKRETIYVGESYQKASINNKLRFCGNYDMKSILKAIKDKNSSKNSFESKPIPNGSAKEICEAVALEIFISEKKSSVNQSNSLTTNNGKKSLKTGNYPEKEVLISADMPKNVQNKGQTNMVDSQEYNNSKDYSNTSSGLKPLINQNIFKNNNNKTNEPEFIVPNNSDSNYKTPGFQSNLNQITKQKLIL